MSNNPIGVLDSGLGGLTVLKEIVAYLPNESFIYIGDSKNTPYGVKESEEIYILTKRIFEFLLSQKVKAIVVACNTITVSCIDRLREDYKDIPVIGTVPAIKSAREKTKNKRIGILATTRTAKSDYQKKLIAEFASDCKVFVYGTDTFVPLIEKGELKGDAMKSALNKAMDEFKKENVDTLVLGSTHFPFLKKQIQEILGPSVSLIDSGEAIARQVKHVLESRNSFAAGGGEVKHSFYTTGDPQIGNKMLESIITGEGFEKITL